MERIRAIAYATPSLEDRRLEAWVTVAGHHHTNQYDTRRTRDLPLLLYCEEGSGQLRLGGRSYDFGRGDLLLQPAHLTNVCQLDPEDGADVWWLIFGGMYSQSLIELIGLSPTSPVLSLDYDDAIGHQFRRIYDTIERQEATAHLDASLQLISLLIGVLKRKKSRTMGTFNPLAHAHYLAEGVDQMAAAAGYSKHHYIRLFKMATGMTPWQYVLHLKVDRAKSLLLDSKRTVKEVAALVGIDNPLYFSRLFKKLTGMSPTQYKHQEADP